MSFSPDFEQYGMPDIAPGFPEEAIREEAKNLQKESKEHLGEIVLVVNRQWEPSSYDTPASRTQYHLETEYKFAILNSPIKIEEGSNDAKIKIETENFLSVPDRYTVKPVWEREGNILDYHESAIGYLSEKESPYSWSRKPEKILEVVIGDAKASDWIEKEVRRDWEDSLNLQNLLKFRKAFRLLGKDLRFSEEGERIAQKELNLARAENLKSIYKLLSVEKMLERDIDRIFGAISSGGVLREGAAVTLVENEDDAKVVSFGKRQRLEETRRRFQDVLNRSFDLGMHENEMLIENEIMPGHKEVIDVKRLVRGLCEKYEIPLPQ